MHTVGELRGIARHVLERRFGRWGRRLHELARGIDDRPVSNERLVQQISSEDTFAEDLPLTALEPHIRELAHKTWAACQRKHDEKHPRVARTVVLKLKTAGFQNLTRSLTPARPPRSERELADIACALRQRVEYPESTRYRLVGVGLSGFVDADLHVAEQSDLFNAS